MQEPSLFKLIQQQGTTPGPRLLITAGVHGDEFEPMAAVRNLSDILKTKEFSGTVLLIPVVNEDAFHRAERTASDHLDLARTCPGDSNGSLTQKLAHQLTQVIEGADYLIDLHTGGRAMSIFPLAGYMLHENLKIRNVQREMARAFNLPMVWGSDPSLNGRTLSVARDANIPAIYVEHGGGDRFDSQAMKALTEGCLNVMASLNMFSSGLPTSKVLYDIIEDRPDSGHLQGSHLSPEDGFFEPVVALGEPIEKGQSIGEIIDFTGEKRIEIIAETTGILNCLRSLRSVHQGDCLAYIVPNHPSETNGKIHE